MDLELRTIRGEEMADLLATTQVAFGKVVLDDSAEFPVHLLEPDRCLAVFDGDAICATAGAYSFRLTVPGGARVPVAGVTIVGVQPTHRRRGLLRAMMDEQLDDVANRGEAWAVLNASEASIYERFGYGVATMRADWEMPRDHARFVVPAAAPGSVRLVDGDAAVAAAHSVYDVAAATRVGEIERPRQWWERLLDPPSADGTTGKPPKTFFTAVHESPQGSADAFARYVVEQHWPHGVPSGVLRVLELHATNPEAEAVLWQYLFDVDLVGVVQAGTRPVDDPIRWRLPDARRMRVDQVRDHLWARVVDVSAALGARTYGSEDALVLELVDAFRPANGGRWHVEGGPDGATCSRTDAEPDLTVSAVELGALSLGGVAASTLHAAGRIQEQTLGAVARADRFFSTLPAPWCSTHF